LTALVAVPARILLVMALLLMVMAWVCVFVVLVLALTAFVIVVLVVLAYHCLLRSSAQPHVCHCLPLSLALLPFDCT
jgi:hypothetical protein